MQWSDILPEVAKLSPVIGTAVAGPAGGAIGLAIGGIISLVTGKQDPQEALQVLQADPTKLAEVANQVNQIHLQFYQARLADVQNARSTMVSLANAHSAIAWGPVVISAIIIVGFFVVVDFMFFVKTSFNDQQANLLNQLFGALIVMTNSVVSYWVGSSRGSQVKDFYMANSQPVTNVLPWKKAA